jgi:hypothetical protein
MGKNKEKRVIAKEAKTMNENNINYDALIKKGILTSKNEISQDKINLISGAIPRHCLNHWTFSAMMPGLWKDCGRLCHSI